MSLQFLLTININLNQIRASVIIFLICFGTSGISNVQAQVEFATWGNLTGIRVDGELLKFGSTVAVVSPGWTKINHTALENQPIKFRVEGNEKIFNYVIDSVNAEHRMESLSPGLGSIKETYTPLINDLNKSVFLCIHLPSSEFTDARITGDKKIFSRLSTSLHLKTTLKQLNIKSAKRQLNITLDSIAVVYFRNDTVLGKKDFQVFIQVVPETAVKGKSYTRSVRILASGEMNKAPVTVTLQSTQLGENYSGFGGNFRLQSPNDPKVIDYCLANLPITWGRVEMPWRFWQAEEGKDPMAEAKAGNLHPRVKAAMEMAQRLSKMNVTLILSNWSAPDWAIVGPYQPRPVNGVWGNALNQEKSQKIYESIANYILYMKEVYNVEIEAFSFNESDLGINVRQTAAEHKKLILELGSYFKSRGLKTKLLLGDTADVNGWPFADSVANDASIAPFVSAVSFHSWRGYGDENLARWTKIAKKINKPLIVGEGSIDAQAWGYPRIFEEPTYASDEINLYLKILSICQPLSILQWQLTADYSLLAGDGLFGKTDVSLYPTQRFYNLKQLTLTPKDSRAVAAASSESNMTCTALRDSKDQYTIHLFNDGAGRAVNLAGLPAGVKNLKAYITNEKQKAEELQSVTVTQGKATFTAAPHSFVTLLSN